LGVSVSEGMEITQDCEEADVIVVNTCGFLESARQESRDAIQDMMAAKRSNSKLLVTGCMVNLKQQQQEILDRFPGIDAVLSSGEIDQVAKTIRGLDEKKHHRGSATTTADVGQGKNKGNEITHQSTKDNNEEQSSSSSAPSSSTSTRVHRRSYLENGDTPRFLATPPHYAYLKIAEGCRKQCSFCIIPKLKGRLQSKPVQQVVEEFQAILQHGTAKEVILIAQDLGDYGKDWNSRRLDSMKHSMEVNTSGDLATNRSKKSHLTRLLEAMLESMNDNKNDDENECDDRFWLRLLYLYPDEITPDLIDLMERDSRIARYVDLPIQHSHNDILKAMRRKTTSEQIQDTIQRLRERLPDICIRTSLMVGFPGESEEHFQHLLDFVCEQKLDHIGVFMYSNEEMAYSSKLDNHVPEHVKQDRYHRLMEAQWQVVKEKHQRWVEEQKRLVIVIEGLHESNPTRIVGRHAGQCPDIDGQVLLEGQPRVFAGERYWVEVTGFDGYDLIARVLQEEEEKING